MFEVAGLQQLVVQRQSVLVQLVWQQRLLQLVFELPQRLELQHQLLL